jgi:hypothetical protein
MFLSNLKGTHFMSLKYQNKIDKQLKRNINQKLKEILTKTQDNPVLKAKTSWVILSEQLKYLLGDDVHRQWFQEIQPIVLKDKTLILQTHTQFAAQWINTHYQELAETLLHAQDPDQSCFFIGPQNTNRKHHF